MAPRIRVWVETDPYGMGARFFDGGVGVALT